MLNIAKNVKKIVSFLLKVSILVIKRVSNIQVTNMSRHHSYERKYLHLMLNLLSKKTYSNLLPAVQ